MPEDAPAVIAGVDTHTDTHTAAVLDLRGRVLSTETFPTTALGYRRLERWCSSFGAVTQVGVEATSSYGRGLCDHLISAGFEVIEVVRPNRQQRRRHGKSDPADAIAAARAVLSGEADSHPKLLGGPVEAIRALHIARASAVKARTQAIVQLHHLIITGPNSIRRQLEPLSNLKRARACAAWRPDMTGASTEAIRYAMRTLARRWIELGEEVEDLTHQLDRLTQQAAPTLRSLSGVGVDTLRHACSSLPVTTPTGSTTKRPSQRSAAPAQSTPHPAANNATASTTVETDAPTTPSGASPSSAWPTTPPHAHTSNAGSTRGSQRKRSCAASSATSPDKPTALYSPTSLRLDRSVRDVSPAAVAPQLCRFEAGETPFEFAGVSLG
jgi:transposase